LYPFLSKLCARGSVRFGMVKVYMEKECRKINTSVQYTGCAQKKRRVHFSLIYRRILIIYTPNKMVVNSLQKALNSHIALRALRIRCQNILFQMRKHIFFTILIKIFILKGYIYIQKKVKKRYYSLCLIPPQ
jgi:hypothetical protein